VDRETASVKSTISGPNCEPRSQNVVFIGCQSMRPWLSFLGCGQLSVRSRSCEPCYQLLVVSETVWCSWCPS
jgi:hypothetical protein